MRKISRPVVFLIGAAIAVAVVVLIGVNLYVQSQGTQARIQQELSHRLGATLHIRRISVTPWGGLKLSGITIPQISAANGSEFLRAKTFRLRVRFLSLFAKRLVIKEVSLVDPNVIWPQNAEGKWRLPTQEGEREIWEQDRHVDVVTSTPTTAPALTSEPLSTASPSKAPPVNTTAVRETPEKSPGAFVPEVRRVNILGGNFRFLDRSGNVVANFENVNFRSSVRNAVALRGNARIEKISLRNRFFLEELQSPLHYDPKELELSKILAHAGNGEVSGHFTMQPQATDSPFTISIKFRNVQADQMVTEAGGPSGVVQGKLEGSLEAAGKTADANALTGAGEIFLRDGQVQQYSLLVALGQVLQIEELTQLHLEQAQAKYHITPGLVTVDELILRSPNIRLTATGTIAFNGKLRLESQLAINEKIRGQLFKPIRANFQPISEPGYSAVDFQVGGTLDRPKSNLMDRVVGRDLKDFVSGLFGGKKADRPKKKKSTEMTPAESPSPSTPLQSASPAESVTSPTP